MQRREAQKMRSEAERCAHVSPTKLKERDRWLLELDGGRYVRGEGHYNDKCYFIAAARAAIRAGKRRVKYCRKPRNTSRTSSYSSTKVTHKQQKRNSEGPDVPSVVTVRNVRRKKHVVSGASRMASLKSNRRYLPSN